MHVDKVEFKKDVQVKFTMFDLKLLCYHFAHVS